MSSSLKGRKGLSDQQLLLYSSVAGAVLFTWWGSGLCVNVLDEFYLVLYALGLMIIPVVYSLYMKHHKN
jgi:hypothetical protein